MPFLINEGDITELDVDCIVNAANTQLMMGGGVCGAIFKAAGPKELAEACHELSPIETSQAVITPGFKLKAKNVIHTAGPIYHDGTREEEKLLRNSYLNSLELAVKENCRSIAFPLISSGIYGYPKEDALRVAREAIESFLQKNDLEVYLVIFDRSAFALDRQLLKDLDSFIARPLTLETVNYDYMARSLREVELEGLLFDVGPGFREKLFELIDDRGLEDVDVYKKANMDRRLFSKIRNQENYNPSKATVMALTLALELNLEEADELLAEAGYAFSPNSKFDVIIQYFILRGIHDIYKINEFLFLYGEKLLGQ